ncbi:MAG: hypothetical protein DHS20C13_00560 [Thermodesulfobacteriota bacterium]|nr:MAG: hypothetical protein DHS20C13_00560 [Thermodesulfobacteriota bacterium]
MRRQTVLVDIPVDIPKELAELSKTFAYVLLNIGSLYSLQLKKELPLDVENGIWNEIPKQLRTAAVPEELKHKFEEQIQNLEKGIYDLYPISINCSQGEMDLIIGKVFASEGESVSYYSGVAGVTNNDYSSVIEQFDSQLDILNRELTNPTSSESLSIKNQAPEIKCIDIFSLAGGLDISHKPICIFFSGESPENISSLSNMTVFLNLYTSRFRALTIEIAKRYLLGAEFLGELSDSEIAILLLIWLRGHDVGHFIGEDNLVDGMSEFDTDYMILHELKSDMIALYSFRFFVDDLLDNGLDEKIYYLSVAEMLRYIRRGDLLNHPDSASAYLAWRYFEYIGAIKYDPRDGEFIVDLVLLQDAVSDFTKELIEIFVEGHVESARQLVRRFGSMEISNENDWSPKDCSENLRQVINDTDVPHYIDCNFVIVD